MQLAKNKIFYLQIEYNRALMILNQYHQVNTICSLVLLVLSLLENLLLKHYLYENILNENHCGDQAAITIYYI